MFHRRSIKQDIVDQVDLVYRVARALVHGDEEAASALLQETFSLALADAKAARRHRRRIRSWLLGLAVQVFARHGATGGPELLLSAEDTAALERIGGRREARELSLERLEAVLFQLTPVTSAVAWAVDVEQLPHAEVAEAFNLSLESVRLRCHRARGQVARCLCRPSAREVETA